MDNILPPLPESEYFLAFCDEGGIHEAHGTGFTPAQMRAYGAECARAARLAEREECAELCDSVLRNYTHHYTPGAFECATAIRARSET